MNQNGSSSFDFGLPEDFFSRYWQIAPVVIRKAGSKFLSETPAMQDFRAASATSSVTTTDGRSIWYVPDRTADFPGVESLLQRARSYFEWDDITCDLFHTSGSSSIGSHFDESENFTIQVFGKKQWRVAPPTAIPSDLQRRRLLGEPGIGHVEMTLSADRADAREYYVELLPGDVLYIPSLWVHCGISEGDSCSVSLVIRAASPYHALMSNVAEVLRHRDQWYRTMPVGPGTRAERAAFVRSAIDAVFRGTAHRDIVESAAVATLPGNTLRKRPPKVDPDLARVRAYLASVPEVPAADLVLPDESVSRKFRALVARRNMKRMLKSVVRRAEETTSAHAIRCYSAVVGSLAAMSDGDLDVLLTDPDVTSWIATDDNTAKLPVPRAEDSSADVLAMAWLAGRQQSHLTYPLELTVRPDAIGGFTLRQLGVQIRRQDCSASHLRLALTHDGLLLLSRLGAIELRRALEAEFHIEALQRLGSQGPLICPAPSAWFSDMAPVGAEVFSPSPVDFKVLCGVLHDGYALLSRFLPSAAGVLNSDVRCIVPLSSKGYMANNYTVPTFRGMIATGARPGFMMAQTLAHEAAHNRMNSILEIVPLCKNPGQRVISPIVNSPRTLDALFHGCVAFAQDIVLTRAMIGHVTDAPEGIMERYLQGRITTVRRTLDALLKHADLLAAGVIMCDEVDAVLSS